MRVHTRYVGDWMGSAYRIDGTRVDTWLRLNPDGTYQRVERWNLTKCATHGRWFYTDGDERLRLEPEGSDERASEWWLLSVTTCEESNCLMVLRELALAARNLPILFYRVHVSENGEPPPGW